MDVQNGTWAAHQLPGWMTIPALTPAGRLLLAEMKPGTGKETLAIYDPASGSARRDVCEVPLPNVRDLKVMA